MKVGMMAITINKNAPKNFPETISQMVIGLVNNNSMVSCFFSSEKLRMVTAGIRKIKIHGEMVKNGLRSANPLFKMLKSPSKTQRKSPLSSRKMAITRYPIGEPKKDLISRSSIDFIYANFYFRRSYMQSPYFLLVFFQNFLLVAMSFISF